MPYQKKNMVFLAYVRSVKIKLSEVIKMRPIMKNYVSDLALGIFILECIASIDESLKLTKELIEMAKHICQICETKHDEVWTCELCCRRVCADHIVGQKIAEDDFMNVCVNCLEK